MKFYLTGTVLFLILTVLPAKALSETLPIGVSLNLSGPNNQSSLEFKTGIDAYLKSQNISGRFGQYKLELIIKDDQGKPLRALANHKRLLANKKVLALLSSQDSELTEQLIPLAKKYQTLLLATESPEVQLTRQELNQVAWLSGPKTSAIDELTDIIKQKPNAALIYDANQASAWSSKLSDAFGEKLDLISLETEPPQAYSLYIVDLNFANAIAQVKELATHSPYSEFVILPNNGSSLIAKTLSTKLPTEIQDRIYYLNSVPIHNRRLKLIKQFTRDLLAYNPQANLGPEALKGYLLAKLATESIYHSLSGIKAESVLDVLTIPFQVIDEVVGWVKHSGNELNQEKVLATFSRMKNYNVGLKSPITLDKSRHIIRQYWLTRYNKSGQFVLSEITRGAS